MRILIAFGVLLTLFLSQPAYDSPLAQVNTPISSSPDVIPVVIHVDASKTKGELRPVWRFFGADEPNYGYMKDGRKLVFEW